MNKDAVSIGFAISAMGGLQGVGSIGCDADIHNYCRTSHPGIGLLLPLGLIKVPDRPCHLVVLGKPVDFGPEAT